MTVVTSNPISRRKESRSAPVILRGGSGAVKGGRERFLRVKRHELIRADLLVASVADQLIVASRAEAGELEDPATRELMLGGLLRLRVHVVDDRVTGHSRLLSFHIPPQSKGLPYWPHRSPSPMIGGSRKP